MKQNVSIKDLPNELLIIIFKRLYDLHREQGKTFRIMLSELDESNDDSSGFLEFTVPPHEERWLGDPFDPCMFPFAHAEVCQLWCALLKLEPTFWTRILIYINSAGTPLEAFADYFRLSRDLPIQIFVKRHPHDHRVQDLEEKARVDALVPYVAQNLHRTKDIHLSVLHQTSLPDLRHWLVGEANMVESIHLSHEYQISGPLAPLREDNAELGAGGHELELRFSAPKLTSLSIDAQMFARACSLSRTWLTNAPNLRSLSVTGAPSRTFSPTGDLSIAATLEVISHARQLASLSVRGIHFLEDGENFQPPPFLTVSSMSFGDLTGTAMAAFVFATGPVVEDLSINHCSLLGLESFYTGTLDLGDLDEQCDLKVLCGDLTTREICLRNCPAFNDSFLDFMADGHSSGEDFPVKGMSTLWLNDCTNFRIEKLYEMILARRSAMEASPAWDGSVGGLDSHDLDELNAITQLYVTGGPFLSEEYRGKFESLVPSFSWTHAEDEVTLSS